MILIHERVEELAKQADEYLLEKVQEENRSSWAQVFAELIVRECISVMKSTVDESIDFERKLDETSSWIESDIKKHFGVEE